MVSANGDMTVFLREMYKAFVDQNYKQFGAVFPQSVFVIGLPATNWAAGTGVCVCNCRTFLPVFPSPLN